MSPKKTRPARRLFGRPPDEPGPQQTYSGAFQLDPAPTSPSQQSHFRLRSASHSNAPPFGPASSREPNGHVPNVHHGRAGPPGGSERGGNATVSSPAAQVSARRDRLKAGDPAGAGPSKQHRPSNAGHRATQSSPAVTTAQAAGANFSRSRSSNTVASDMASGSASNSVPGPHSLPASLHDAPLVPAPGYRGARSLAPSTSVQHSPYGIASSVHTPSSGSLASVGYRNRQPSFDYSDASPTDTSSRHFPSPSPAPHTPNSLRGTSIPPSVRSEPSPFLGLMIGDFSPDMAPLDAEGEELPPLSPDLVFPDPPRAGYSGRPRSHSAANATSSRYGGLLMSAEASHSSVSVPEEPLLDLHWPPGIFGFDSQPYAVSNLSGDELTQLPGFQGHYPPSGRRSSGHPAPGRPSGF
ncbi:hypothetical protein C8Q78DRAFT_357979 [Trametes maxima]|nr:hypothetical protein C8Q78DRAFT_357979 [Trametes maxima]